MSDLRENDVAVEIRVARDSDLEPDQGGAAPAPRRTPRVLVGRLRLGTWLPPLVAFGVLGDQARVIQDAPGIAHEASGTPMASPPTSHPRLSRATTLVNPIESTSNTAVASG